MGRRELLLGGVARGEGVVELVLDAQHLLPIARCLGFEIGDALVDLRLTIAACLLRRLRLLELLLGARLGLAGFLGRGLLLGELLLEALARLALVFDLGLRRAELRLELRDLRLEGGAAAEPIRKTHGNLPLYEKRRSIVGGSPGVNNLRAMAKIPRANGSDGPAFGEVVAQRGLRGTAESGDLAREDVVVAVRRLRRRCRFSCP
jgi:hypothetical protein